MSHQVGQINALLRKYVGVGLGVALLVPLALAGAGIAVGLFFPKVRSDRSAAVPGTPEER